MKINLPLGRLLGGLARTVVTAVAAAAGQALIDAAVKRASRTDKPNL